MTSESDSVRDEKVSELVRTYRRKQKKGEPMSVVVYQIEERLENSQGEPPKRQSSICFRTWIPSSDSARSL